MNRWLARMMRPADPSITPALVGMGHDAAETLDRLTMWARRHQGSPGAVEDGAFRAAATAARVARRGLARAVADSFLLPIDPEEVLELAERLEAVTTSAYLLHREIVLLGAPLEPDLVAIIEHAATAATSLAESLTHLQEAPAQAADIAERLLDTQWEAADAYARLIRARSRSDVPGALGPAQREVARRAEDLMERVAHVARRVVHTVAKRA